MSFNERPPPDTVKKSWYLAGSNGGQQWGSTFQEAQERDHPFDRGHYTFYQTYIYNDLGCDQEEAWILYSCEQCIVWAGGDHIAVTRGEEVSIGSFEPGFVATLKEGFGDSERMHGCLDKYGAVWTLTSGIPNLHRASRKEQGGSPPIDHIAEAGDGKICISCEHLGDFYLLQFENVVAFLEWYEEQKAHRPMWTKPISLRVKQLVANKIVFLCLLANGDVMSWGNTKDISGRLMGRLTDAIPAKVPDFIGGLDDITEIRAGGFFCGAMDKEGSLWCWGTDPVEERDIAPIFRSFDDGENVAPFPKTDENGAPIPPVIDFAVGQKHIAVVVQGGSLWMAGDNGQGQLGAKDTSGSDIPGEWSEEWYALRLPLGAERVICGPKCTLIYASKSAEPDHPAAADERQDDE